LKAPGLGPNFKGHIIEHVLR